MKTHCAQKRLFTSPDSQQLQSLSARPNQLHMRQPCLPPVNHVQVASVFRINEHQPKGDNFPENRPKTYCYDIFIRNTLGRYLPACLQEVTELKPADPIQYIANWLYKVYDSQMYYKAKVNYLQEIYQLDEILQRDKQEHQARIKPFMQAMEAERWNYFVSLHAELVALEEVMAHVDVEVDEGTKLRFLEVQLLIKEEEGQVKDPEVVQLATESTSEKVVEEEPETVKSKTSIPVSVRNSPEVVAERTSIVMEEMPALEESASGRLARSRLPPVRRLVRNPRRPLNQRRLSTPGLSTVQQARATAIINKSAASDLTPDSDKSMWSSQSLDSKDDDLKQRTTHTDICQLATTNFFRYVLDESGSYIMDSLRSSQGSSDSDTDQQGRSEVYERGQQVEAVSATKRCFDAAMSYSDDEDPEIQACEIDMKSSDDSLSTSSRTRTTKYFTEGPQLPVVVPKGKHAKENIVISLPDNNEKAFIKTSHRTVHGLPRKSALSQNENVCMEYQTAVLEVSEETDICRFHRKDDCGGFHLPPVRRHGNASRVVSANEVVEVSNRQEEAVSGWSASSDRVVHLPAITGSRTTGTLVMTNSGHIAFVNKRLGVIASNSLKIRSVHPIDKPEMWARRNFQRESFYDHELYGETDHALADSEDDERWHSSTSRMTTEEFVEPPYRRWKKPKEDDLY